MTNVTDHSLVETEEGSTTLYRCEDCGLTYQHESAFEMYRCSPIHKTEGSTNSETPPESNEF